MSNPLLDEIIAEATGNTVGVAMENFAKSQAVVMAAIAKAIVDSVDNEGEANLLLNLVERSIKSNLQEQGSNSVVARQSWKTCRVLRTLVSNYYQT